MFRVFRSTRLQGLVVKLKSLSRRENCSVTEQCPVDFGYWLFLGGDILFEDFCYSTAMCAVTTGGALEGS